MSKRALDRYEFALCAVPIEFRALLFNQNGAANLRQFGRLIERRIPPSEVGVKLRELAAIEAASPDRLEDVMNVAAILEKQQRSAGYGPLTSDQFSALRILSRREESCVDPLYVLLGASKLFDGKMSGDDILAIPEMSVELDESHPLFSARGRRLFRHFANNHPKLPFRDQVAVVWQLVDEQPVSILATIKVVVRDKVTSSG